MFQKAKQVGKREEAIQFLREKKKMMKDLAQVTEAKKHPNVPPPEYRIQVMKKQEVVTNPDLAMEHMELNIIRCIDVRYYLYFLSLSYSFFRSFCFSSFSFWYLIFLDLHEDTLLSLSMSTLYFPFLPTHPSNFVLPLSRILFLQVLHSSFSSSSLCLILHSKNLPL